MGEAPKVDLEQLELVRAGVQERPVVDRLWQLYFHDLSQFRGSVPDAEGFFRRDRVGPYFEDPDRCGYLVRWAGTPLGFALVRGLLDERRLMGEFFVVRSMRRQGVGYAAARGVLARHPGAWDIPFQEENPTAARFWRRLATDVAGDTWTEDRIPVPDKPHLPPDVWLRLTA